MGQKRVRLVGEGPERTRKEIKPERKAKSGEKEEKELVGPEQEAKRQE